MLKLGLCTTSQVVFSPSVCALTPRGDGSRARPRAPAAKIEGVPQTTYLAHTR